MSGRVVPRLKFTAAMLLLCTPCALAGTIGLSWDPSVGATGYRVFYGPSENNYFPTPLYDGPGTATTITNSALTDCTTWHFVVTAYNAAGESDHSNDVYSWTRPAVATVSPAGAMQGTAFSMTVTGASFQPAATLTIQGNPNVRLENSTISCDGACNCQIVAAATVEPTASDVQPAKVGTFAVTVTNHNPEQCDASDPGCNDVAGSRSQAFQVVIDPARFDINRTDTNTRDRLDGKDIVWHSRMFGLQEADATYDPDYDFDGNGIVDGEELALLTSNIGRCWDGVGWSVSACP